MATLHQGLQVTELRLFQIEGIKYLATPLPSTPRLSLFGGEVVPVTVIETPGHETSETWINRLVQGWLDVDDVLHRDFLKGVVFVTDDKASFDTDAMTKGLQSSFGTSWSTTMSAHDAGTAVTSGPFVLWKGELLKVARLYDDSQQAFVVATKPHIVSGAFENLRISSDFFSSLSVAVPSRIKSSCDINGPLRGARFAVKDIFAIDGLRQTAGCRAWFDLSKTSTATAPALQRLIDEGANLVGTLKLGSLITREEPTESADYHAAFNPRGDGYQSAWSSSGGSGASVASYEWLDFTLGTDTTGSSRRPALANGHFQIRLTQTALSLEGIVPSWKYFDAPAMYTRDIRNLEKWVGAWISEEPQVYQSSMSIIYPRDFLPVANTVQMGLIDKFVQDLEATFDVRKTELSIADLWKEKTPQEARGADITEFLKDVGVKSFCYGVAEELQSFRDEYWKKHSKAPYVNPVMRWRLEAAANVTREQHEDAVDRLRIYKRWLIEEVLQVGKQDSIVVLPITSQAVDYRDVPPDPPSAPNAFDGIWLASTLGAPEISVPIGEMEYDSRVSQRKEYLPIVVSLLGAPGTDMALIDAARRTLEYSGRSLEVTTGSRMNISTGTA
ncbi:amidase signature domain-containing protein [Lophiotrema nucula]|uniref:Amidase signature domain-containing protein n=1 Tax=Lophiotrema nucula TaxID=690887 RepID=A0A6A5ZF00_9PLEO|nr:amidase signature domain-containing protein [Lophiotrema nucula]